MINQRTEENRIYFEKSNGEITFTLTESIVNEKTFVVQADGELTSETIHIFEDEMVSASIYFDKIVLDCQNLTYISKAIIRFLLQLQHMMEDKDGELILKNISSGIKEAFVDMGLEDMFDFQ